MTELRTFYTDIYKFLDANRVKIKDKDLYHHLINVLRYKENSFFNLIGKNRKLLLKILDFNKVSLEIICEIKGIDILPLEKNKVNLFISYIRRKNFEWILSQISQFSAFNIYVLQTQRSKQLLIKDKAYKIKRWNKIIKNSLEVSKLTIFSKLYDIINLEKLKDFSNKDNITLYLSVDGVKLSTFISIYEKLIFNKLNVIIGPEGGFTESEDKFILSLKNVYKIKLLDYILKAETSLIYFLSIFKYFHFI